MIKRKNIVKVLAVSVICLLMLVITSVGTSQPTSERNIEGIKEEPTDYYRDCKIQVLGNIVEYEIIYFQYSWGNLYTEVYCTTLFIKGYSFLPTLIVRASPSLVRAYYGDIRIEMDYFLGILYLGDNITFCRGRVHTLRVEFTSTTMRYE